jgi:Transposase IS66 family
VLVVRTPHRGLTWLRALGSRQAAAITAILSFFTGFLISDGYSAYQQLLPQLAGGTVWPVSPNSARFGTVSEMVVIAPR